MDKYIGKLLDNRYEVLESVGVGGMATIYKARCRVLNRFVAIKILKDEYAQDEEFRRRFYLESQAVAKLSHPNIVAVYDVSHTEGLEYIVMELVEGVTLKEYLQKKGHLSWQETLYFAQQVARALSHAHSRGIIHQDIKPQNIMITNEGTAKVTDFGIASFAANQETRVVQEAIGSVHYISPEQAKGSNVDYRTDIYSLGVVMYEMLTGKLPFEGETALSIVMQHINAIPLQPSEVVPGVPAGMDEIVMHAMCPAVSRRYPSADELYADLQRLKNDAASRFGYDQDASRGDAPQLDETQALPNFHEARQSAASHPQPAAQPQYAPRPQQKQAARQKTRVRDEEREGSSSTVVAVIAVVAFAVIALVVAGMLVFGNGSPEKIEVQSFIGMQISSVVDVESGTPKAEFADFKFELVPTEDANKENGVIYKQDPEANKKATPGSIITLYYYIGNKTADFYKVPDFKNKTKEFVEETITAHNENSKSRITYQFVSEPSTDVDKDLVTRTEPQADSTMREGDELIVYISTGKTEIEMIDVMGDPIENAVIALEDLGLKVKKQEEPSEEEKGKVIDQSVKAGEKVKAEDTIVLTVSNGVPPETDTPVDGDAQDPNGGEAGGDQPQSGTATVYVNIPEDARASAHIVVKLDDGTVAYDNTLSDTGEQVSVKITASGPRFMNVFVNDQPVGEGPVVYD